MLVDVKPVFAAPNGENTWTTKAPLPVATAEIKAAEVNGKIYVIGDSLNYEYDPVNDNWTSKTPMPTPRDGCFGIAVCQNKIYVLGGENNTSSGFNYLSTNEIYDPSTDIWATKQPMPTSRAWVQANTFNGKIYVMSGETDNYRHSLSAANEVYDPSTDSWITEAPVPYSVIKGVSAVIDDKIYLLGGLSNITSDLDDRTNQIYDTSTGTWSLGIPVPNETGYAAAAATSGFMAPKRIYVMGGGFDQVTNTVNVYDPMSDTWVSGAPLPTNRTGFALAAVNDVLYAVGGGFNFYGFRTMGGWNLTATNEAYTPVGYGTVPPVITVNSPTANTNYSSEDIPLNFAVNKQVNKISYSLDGSCNITVDGNSTLAKLSNGLHNVTVYAQDALGNIGLSDTVNFSVDVLSLDKPVLFSNGSIVPVAVASGIVVVAVGVGLFVYHKKRSH